ncbi:hypothetical protein MSAN_02112000 [Mycena sanguinolenta]|uniref:Uncharacterized protein n=1 Tax=Mycena sanguinolenta TaxID=230812 RepID=A0A8H7CLY7_9AGAR|nr:hypothetical protein MSAN_02112000 [Mycena sanguinolenta]
MTIPSSAIVEWAKPIDKFARNVPGTDHLIRRHLERTWGLENGTFDEHVREFVDPQNILTDETPPTTTLSLFFLSRENRFGKLGVSRSHVQKLYNKRKTFEYLVLPIHLDPMAIDRKIPCPPAQILTSGVPPHLALCTTFGKMLNAWSAFSHIEWEAECLRLVLRARGFSTRTRTRTRDDNNDKARPVLAMRQFSEMEIVFRNWAREDFVPPSFRGTCELKKRKSRDGDEDEPRAKRLCLPPRRGAPRASTTMTATSRASAKRWVAGVVPGFDADELPLFNDAQIELNDGQMERVGGIDT